MGLSAIFDNCLLPLAIEGGKCIFKLMLISWTYLLIRGNVSESVKKVKMATIGYVLLGTIRKYVELVDSIIDGLSF